MNRFRYQQSGRWYRGNTHLHSVASDGSKTFAELADLYSGAGYDFLFRTDHWVCSEVGNDVEASPLLWMDGIEIDGRDALGANYHVVCLGTLKGLDREIGFQAALDSARDQGSLLILAHPRWIGNSIEEALRHGFHGVEVYNNTCRQLNGKGSAGFHWDQMLKADPSALGLAADDVHFQPHCPEWKGGWIVVRAPRLDAISILRSIRDGNFYSSTGPSIHEISFNGQFVRVKTSPVKAIRLVGDGTNGDSTGRLGNEPGPNGSYETDSNGLIVEASFALSDDWPYSYFEIEDEQEKTAWTNALFV